MNYLNTPTCMDAIEFLRELEDKSVDLCLTDPPYNAKNIGPDHKSYSKGIMQLPLPEYKKFCKSWFKEAMRVSKIIVFTPGIANMCYYPQPYWCLCWHKPAACSFNRMQGYNAWEPIFVYGEKLHWVKMPQDYILFNTLNFTKGPERDHPCPKPLGLWGMLIEKFSKEGQLVCDPMGGAFTTMVACKILKRNCVSVDHDPAYVEIGMKRLEGTKTLWD